MRRSLVISIILTFFVLLGLLFHRWEAQQVSQILRAGSPKHNIVDVLHTFHKNFVSVNKQSSTLIRTQLFAPPSPTRARKFQSLKQNDAPSPEAPSVIRPDFKVSGIIPGEKPVAFLIYQGSSRVVELGQQIWGCTVHHIASANLTMKCDGALFEYAP